MPNFYVFFNLADEISGIGEKLIPNWFAFLVQLISLIVLVVVIFFFAYKPVKKILDKRADYIEKEVKDAEENTRTYQVGEDVFGRDEDRKQQVQMINRFNPYICEAFYANRVILVEGDTEAIVYRDLLSRFFPKEEVFVLNTGSKNNFPFFQEILTAFHIKHCAIHDVDTELLENTHHNSAWTLNQTIWNKIEEANRIEPGLARRYVHNANFENAHKYNLLAGKDKPLQAYKFAKTITSIDDDVDCLRWLKDYLGEQIILHDMEYVKKVAKTCEQIAVDETTYQDV